VEIPEVSDPLTSYYEAILSNLYSLQKEYKNPRPTFSKTVSFVSEKNSLDEEKVKLAMENLLEKGYVTQYETLIGRRKVRLLKAHFSVAEKDGIFKTPKD
jgi:hypothetical protein